MNALIHSYNTETVSQQRHETKEKCANMENPYTVSRGAFLAAAKSNLSSSHQLDLLNMFNSGDYTELNTCLNFSQKNENVASFGDPVLYCVQFLFVFVFV